MAIKTIDDTHLKQIANAIREKTGSAEGISVDEMPEQIKGIEGGAEPVLQDKTVTPTTSSQTITADSGYDGLSKVTVNAMATATQATPSITVSSAGLITASATQSAGYVAAGTKSATKQLTTQAAKTIAPTKSSQTAVAKDRYTTGVITVAAIPSQYITTTDATATAADIRLGKTAYVNGSKITGTVEDFDGEYECDGGSTGGGGATVETCAVTIKRYAGSSSSYSTVYYTTLVNGNVAAADMELEDTGNISSYTTFNIICLKNSVLTMYFDAAMGSNVNMSSGSILVRNGYDMLVVKLGDADNITIDVGASGGGSN